MKQKRNKIIRRMFTAIIVDTLIVVCASYYLWTATFFVAVTVAIATVDVLYTCWTTGVMLRNLEA